MAKLILTHEVPGLGSAGDVVDVKDGYANNFLLRRKLATSWSKGGEKQVADIRKARKVRELASLEEAQAVAASISANVTTISARSGDGQHLFGAVSTADIAAAVEATSGKKIDKRTIHVDQPIKRVGEAKVTVRLHADIVAHVKLNVVAAK
ncbi:50S ribosomal protein L9 [Micrococcales bacterium 31B]|nr:50S ribosomal protein L9 [Micrococcales bacterium 31B]